MQVLTTIGWADCLDHVSRRLLTDALRAAAHPDNSACLHVFAVAARDLFRHASHTLAARHKGRARRRCFRHPSRAELSDPFVPGPLHDELLVAIDDLRNHARLRPRVAVVESADADRSLQEALSALRSLFDSIGDYLEQVLQPLAPHVGRHALQAFIHETRREVDELAACHTVGDVYVESLTISETDGKAISLEVEGALGCGMP